MPQGVVSTKDKKYWETQGATEWLAPTDINNTLMDTFSKGAGGLLSSRAPVLNTTSMNSKRTGGMTAAQLGLTNTAS